MKNELEDLKSEMKIINSQLNDKYPKISLDELPKLIKPYPNFKILISRRRFEVAKRSNTFISFCSVDQTYVDFLLENLKMNFINTGRFLEIFAFFCFS